MTGSFLTAPLSLLDNLNWLTVITLTLLVLTGVRWYLQHKKAYKWAEQFDGPTPFIPFIGNLHIFLGHPTKVHKVLHEASIRFGNTWRLWIKNSPTILTTDLELIKEVLLSTSHLNKHSVYSDVMVPSMGNLGLLTSEANQWKTDRKLFNKAFSASTIKSYFDSANKTSQEIVEVLSKKSGTPVDSYAFFMRYALSIFLQTVAHGVSLTESQINTTLEIVESIEDVARVLGYRPWFRIPILWWLSGYHAKQQKIHKLTRTLFSQLGDSVAQQDQESLHILSELIFTKKYDPAWQYQHAIHFLGAASETAAYTVTVTLFYLAVNPQLLEIARNEVDDVFNESPSKTLEFSSLSKLKFTKMCFKESMRIQSPASLMGRTLGEDITLADGRRIPKGAEVLILMGELSKRPDLFPDPEKFDPERFNEERIKGMDPLSYIPFSAGPRDCVGKKAGEMKSVVLIANMLRHFHISTDQKPENLRRVNELVTHFSPPISLSFQKRY